MARRYTSWEPPEGSLLFSAFAARGRGCVTRDVSLSWRSSGVARRSVQLIKRGNIYQLRGHEYFRTAVRGQGVSQSWAVSHTLVAGRPTTHASMVAHRGRSGRGGPRGRGSVSQQLDSRPMDRLAVDFESLQKRVICTLLGALF
eukprot:5503768-Prymnesium_polylepis.1